MRPLGNPLRPGRATWMTLAVTAVLMVGAASACRPTEPRWQPAPTTRPSTTTTAPPTTAPPTTLPPTGPARFTVDASGGSADASPGDGICEATTGIGDCTLQAALDEADAHPETVITIVAETGDPSSTYRPVDATITTEVTIDAMSAPETDPGIGPGAITVADGASLTMRRIGIGFGAFEVAGSLTLSQVAGVASIHVAPSGRADLSNVFLDHAPSTPLTNEGRLNVRFSSITAWDRSPVIHTSSGALTTVGASVLNPGIDQVEAPGAETCTGQPPRSAGSNLTVDDSCMLDGPGDRIGEPAPSGPPGPGAPQLDAVPVGVLGCGTQVDQDLPGVPRPTDGDGDGTAACDIGAWEAPARAGR